MKCGICSYHLKIGSFPSGPEGRGVRIGENISHTKTKIFAFVLSFLSSHNFTFILILLLLPGLEQQLCVYVRVYVYLRVSVCVLTCARNLKQTLLTSILLSLFAQAGKPVSEAMNIITSDRSTDLKHAVVPSVSTILCSFMNSETFPGNYHRIAFFFFLPQTTTGSSQECLKCMSLKFPGTTFHAPKAAFPELFSF